MNNWRAHIETEVPVRVVRVKRKSVVVELGGKRQTLRAGDVLQVQAVVDHYVKRNEG